MFDRLKALFRRTAREDVHAVEDVHRAHIARLLEQLQPLGNEGASLDAVLAVANGRLSPQQLQRLRTPRARPGNGRQEREHLQESASPNNAFWQSIVDPSEPIWDQTDFWQPLGFGANVPWSLNNTLKGEVLPVYINEMGLNVIRDYSRKLLAFNEFALNAVENRVSYIVGKGYQYKAVLRQDTSPQTAADDVDNTSGVETNSLCRKVQAVIDEFVDREHWGEREQECVRRCDRDGEALLRFFHIGEGKTAVRFVEPELLTDTSGQTHRQYGVITDPDDIEDVHGYSIVEHPGDGMVPTDVPAEEVVHIKLNTDFTAKRGLPTLFPVRKNLERADKLLRNMSILAQVQATFAVIRKHKQFSPSSVSAYQQAQGDQSITLPVTGRALQLQQFFPGMVLDTSDKTEYEFPGAKVDASGLVAVLQAELRAVAARLVMTEWMLTVDASNANYASSLVAEAPAVKNFERLHAVFARRFGDGQFAGCRRAGAIWRVIHNAVEYGRLPREALTAVEIQVEGPSLVVRDKSKETARAKELSEAGLLSDATWSKWEGLDHEQEKRQGAKPKGQGGGPPGAGPPAAPGGDIPPSAPPGSGGGDGADSDPLDFFGEAFEGLEDFFSEACVANRSGAGYHDDKTGRRCKKPGSATTSPRPAKAERPELAKVKAHVQGLAGGHATAEQVAELGATLARMTVAQLRQLKRETGIRAGGVKATMVAKIAKEATRRLTERQHWQRQARIAGVRPAEMLRTAGEMYAIENGYVATVQNMLSEARALYRSLNDGKALTRGSKAFRDGDHSQLPRFDVLARSMAERYPELLGAHGYSQDGYDDKQDEAGQRLFDFLAAGTPKRLSRGKSYEQALDYIREHGARAQAAVPAGPGLFDDDDTGEVPF